MRNKMENENVPGIVVTETTDMVTLTAQKNSQAAVILHMLSREFNNGLPVELWKIVYPSLCYYQEVGQKFELVLGAVDGWLNLEQRKFLATSVLPGSRTTLQENEYAENAMYAQVLEGLEPELRSIVNQRIEMLEVSY